MILQIIFIILATAGIADASYLVWKRVKNKPLTCPINHDCQAVVESGWNRIFFFHNDVMGLLYYVAMFFGGWLLFFTQGYVSYFPVLLLIATGFGFLFSMFLVGIMQWVLKEWCLYCIFSAIISTFLFLVMLAGIFL